MKRFIFLFVIVAVVHQTASAQKANRPAAKDSVIHAFIPGISYSSNEGLIIGGLYNRFDYRGGIKPFNNYLEASALASFKGFIEVEGSYEKTRSFGRKIRSEFNIFFRRYLTDNFFGVGNSTSFSQNRWEDGYYYFESISFGVNFLARKPVYSDNDSQLDFLFGAGSEYHIPYVRKEPSYFARFTPNGSDGGWVNYLNAGLIWENRDHEFDPHTGNHIELEFRLSPALISTYGLATARFEYLQYFYLFNFLTVANRFAARHAMGDVPFWELSKLGDSITLRGYPLNRFQGNSFIAYTFELRAWVIKFPDFYKLKFGGQLFTDIGRVFTPQADFGDLFEDYKQTVGFGVAMSVLSPQLIIRGDIGFSEDMNQVYIGVGYAF
ncbi:MAG TPA: hypothetical protein VF181_06650 [Balneolaceae bacterium]